MNIHILLFYIVVSIWTVLFGIFVYTCFKVSKWLVKQSIGSVSKYTNSRSAQSTNEVKDKEYSIDLDKINAQLDMKRAERIMRSTTKETISEGIMCAETVLENDNNDKEAIASIRKLKKG